MEGHDSTYGRGTLHILLVEGRADLRSALKLVLKELMGLEVGAEASSLDELNEELIHKCPNLILLDWEILGQEAVRILSKIRTLYPDIKTVVIDNSEETREKALMAGADDFAVKGGSPDRLVEVLNSICCQQGWVATLTTKQPITQPCDEQTDQLR